MQFSDGSLGNCHKVSTMARIDETVVVVLVLNQGRVKLIVVNPNIGASLFGGNVSQKAHSVFIV